MENDTSLVKPEHFQLLCNKLNSGALLLDKELKVVFINDWLLQLLPFEHGDILGRDITELLPKLAETRFIHAVDEAFRSKVSTRLSASFQPNIFGLTEPVSKQSLVHSTSISLIDNDDVPLCFINVQDETKPYKREQLLQEYIGKLKVAERLLESARDEAISANEAKNIFLSNMSHQLKTPLNAIIGFAELLSESNDGTFSGIQLDSIRHIRESGNNLNRFIQQVLLLMATKSEQTPSEECCLSLEIRKLVDEFSERSAESSITFNCRMSDSISNVETNNRSLCVGLLRNLFDIAVACQTPGTTIDVTVNPSFGMQCEIQLSADFLRIPLVDEGKKQGVKQASNQFPNTDLDISFLLDLSNRAAQKLEAVLHFERSNGLQLQL